MTTPHVIDLLPPLLSGLKVTLLITAGAAVVAALLSFAVGLMRVASHRALNVLAMAYIDFFRGTSALVQLFWAYFALPLVGVSLDAMTVAIVVLGLNIGSYGAEVVRGAIQSVPKGQYEAAEALNFSPLQTLWKIVLPQAFVIMLPSFGNLLVELLKSTALVSLITISDLTFQAQALRASTMRSAEIFLVIMALYFFTALAMTRLTRWLEQKYSYVK